MNNDQDRARSETEQSIWRMGARDLLKKHPWFVVLILVISTTVTIGVDKAFPATTPETSSASNVIECGDGSGCATVAARKFRRHKITHNQDGLRTKHVFAHPKKAKRIIVGKFQRLIHNRYHSGSSPSARLTTSGGLCTADTVSCAKEWYNQAVTSRCIAIGPVYVGGEQRCTEPYEMEIETATVREQVKALACTGGAALLLSPGPGWVRWAAFPASLDTCWSLVD